MASAYDENMRAVIVLPSDFPYDDVRKIGLLLQDAELLVPGYIPPQAGLYNPDCFLFEVRVGQVEFSILPDRNLVSRIARVGRGEELDSNCQVAAALMAFAQCLNLTFEPSIAFHELAHREGNRIAQDELRSFLAADEAGPEDWLDVALGRARRFKGAGVLPDIVEHDLAKPIRRWNRNYILALKVAELELQAGPAVDKVVRLLDWMHSDFVLGGPAALFASLYFAPSAPRRRMLKHLRSPHRERAIDGVRNAAWDITQISDFVRRVSEEGSDRKRFLLATADRSLARIGSLAFHYGNELDSYEMLAKRLRDWWTADDAERIAATFSTYVERSDDPTRKTNSVTPGNHISDLISAGEERLLEWRPSPRTRLP